MLAVTLLVALTAPARGASKFSVAATLDKSPDGGSFIGPSFVGEGSAAGTGWVAFRALVQGKTKEQIVVQNMRTGQSAAAASLSQSISKEIGTFQQFLGKPTVNARGDVAFAALVKPPDGVKTDLSLPPWGGIFLYSQGNITVVAAPNVDTGAGVLDLTTPINIGVTDSIDVAERTPALNDNGDVAFVASTVTKKSDGSVGFGAALFRRRAGQNLETVFTQGGPNPGTDGGTFDILGPPALNNAGTLAFHATLSGLSAPLDGVFTLDGGTVSRLIRDGAVANGIGQPVPLQVPGFDDVVVLNDQGDVACTGGPPVDLSNTLSLNVDLDSSGVILIPHGGAPVVVGYPGQSVTEGDQTAVVWSINLGPDAGSRVAPPSFAPGGAVVFFAQVNGSGGQQILRADPSISVVQNLVSVGGSSATQPTPAGGTYQSASSAPAVDATGALAFSARLENAPTTSQGFFYLPIPQTSAPPQYVPIGAPAADSQGVIAGAPFSPPQLTDSGDVIFKSFVAKGSTPLGIFRYREGTMDTLVRVGDPAPAPPGLTCDTATFTNLLGTPSVNAHGDVAFAATMLCCVGQKCQNQGRGLFVRRGPDGPMQALALPNLDITLQSPPADKVRKGPAFRTLGANPALDDSGAVAFRATLEYESPFDPFSSTKENGVYVIDDAGIHLLAWQGQDSGAGAAFFSFADPTIRSGSVFVRAVIGTISDGPKGFFVVNGSAPQAIAIEGRTVNGMSFATVNGRGVAGPGGEVVFTATVGDDTGLSLLRWTGTSFDPPIARVGDPGPQGGVIRSISPPSVSSTGSIAFRLTFLPVTGGVPGVYLAAGGPLQPFLRIGEGGGDGVGGKVTGINKTFALNASDEMALLATVGGGTAGSAVLLAAPSTLAVGQLGIRRGPGPVGQNTDTPKKRDQVRVSAVLKPAKLPLPPADKKAKLKPVALGVAVADTKGNLWSVNLPSKAVKVSGRTFVAKRSSDTKSLQSLRVRVAKDGTMRVAVRSALFSFSDSGNASLGHTLDDTGAVVFAPPFNIRVDVGGQGGTAQVDCTPKPRRFHCGG